MRIKELFTVPENEKVTEKRFYRVLISSVCSILLCMGCLVSTTWAWFAVSLENTGNLLQIAAPAVTLTVDSSTYQETVLASGTRKLTVTLDEDSVAEKDSFGNTSDVYVILSFVEEDTGKLLYSGYAVLNADNTDFTVSNLEVNSGTNVKISTQVSWLEPGGVSLLGGSVVLGEAAAKDTDPAQTAETTQSTEADQTTEATVETEASATEPQTGTEPTETTEPAVT